MNLFKSFIPFAFVLLLQVQLRAQVVINEIQSVNESTIKDFQDEYPDWIELYNSGNSDVNLTGFGLSDKADNPFLWIFPNITITAGQYLIVFASSKDTVVGSELHTNFKLSSAGEEIYLTNKNGLLVDFISVVSLKENQSYARITDGGSIWEIYSTASPSLSNQTGVKVLTPLKQPITSYKAGFYFTTLSVELSCADVGAEVYYSLDGTVPFLQYAQPIELVKSTVIKSACRKVGSETSGIKTDSYFINEEHDLPVVSLSFRPEDFYDADSGIYVLGNNHENAPPYYGANFWQDWERNVHFEYFVDGDEKIEQDLGVKIFGGYSRSNAMKSLRLIPRKEYGKSTIDYKFFEEKPYLDKFDQLVLRNGGNDFNGSMWSDALNHRALSAISEVDMMAYQPVVVYFNGEYKGVHNLRERVNTEYISKNRDFSSENFDFLEFNAGVYLPNQVLTNGTLEDQTKEGTNEGFVALYEFITQNDMNIQSNYAQVVQQLDIKNYIDYFAAQIYHINADWPHNNIRFWRSPDYDGKWRFLYYDTEFGKGLYGSMNTQASRDELNRVITDDRSIHSMMFKALLENEQFRYAFVNRSADFMNTIYTPNNFRAIADEFESKIVDEMDRHLAVYNGCCRQNNLNTIYNFIDSRPSFAREDITSQFNYNQNSVTLAVVPEEAGVIKISTIIPEEYPWTGVYYNDVPVVITALPNPGYTFSNWIGVDASSIRDTIFLTGTNTSIIANFNVQTTFTDIKITEVNYHSIEGEAQSGDWVELYNNGTATADLSGWLFRDAHVAHEFILPAGTALAPGEYLVLSENVSYFTSVYPTVNNVIGNFDFGLNNGGDELFLVDTNGRIQLHLKYDDKAPWPQLADGKGATLELKSTDLDYKVAENWKANCKNGSPGRVNVNCDCSFNVDLGEDIVDCSSPLALTLNSNLGASNRSFYWYVKGDLVSVNPTYMASKAGLYELVVIDGTCIKNDELTILNEITVDLGSDVYLCSPRYKVLDAGLNVPAITYLWKLDGEVWGDQSSIIANIPGTYSVEITTPKCALISDEIVVSSNGPIVEKIDFCEEDSSAVLTVVGDGVYEWFTSEEGGTSLGSTDVLEVSALNSDTVFYVQDNTFEEHVIGRSSIINGSGQLPTTTAMEFTVINSMTLVAVSVQPQSRFGNVTVVIRILDELGNVVKSVTATVSGNSLTRIELDAQLNPGNYKLDAFGTKGTGPTSGNLMFESAAGGFPYPATDIISITGNSRGTTDYYYFYNWEVQKGEKGCSRVPVFLTSNDCMLTPITEADQKVKFNMYPNPTSNWIEFSSDIEKVNVLTLDGQVIISNKVVEGRLDLTALNSGVYFVEMWNQGELKVEKLLITK